MKNLTVTVNGVAYNVTVEENTNGAAPVAAPAAAPAPASWCTARTSPGSGPYG